MVLSEPPLMVELRLATDADVEAILADLCVHMSGQQRDVFGEKLLRYVRKPDRDLMVAIHGGQIVGLVCVVEQAEVPGTFLEEVGERLRRFASCTQLLVHPHLRRQGIGTSLFSRLEDWARDRGREGCWLVTHRMADWYRNHFDYEELGRIREKGIEKVIMAKKFE